ncbi:methylenetetrahydrofolate reductase [Sulfurospirillum arcachonense]|uniref:methylenetetrahydrofolate reductase n=1 Tax=Sulfurospirillum arcachonense TaxID=57666 RepID=UPI0004694032|nr:methylenetetrahydrofolate reductase [Sulfurospirillum arcachonense]
MLTDKIRSKESGILFYGLTPPKAKHTKEELETIAAKHIERLNNLDIDGLVLYDIQDESDRTDIERPFPFIKTLDPCDYAKNYLDAPLKFPIVVYKAVGKYDKDEFRLWLQERVGKRFHTVFVGAASKDTKVTIGMKEAYDLKKEISPDITLGGIMIPERHIVKHDEHLRVFSKIDNGCEFFVSQCVYDLMAAKKFLDDYAAYAKEHNKPLVPIIFTITPCGSAKTLDFMKWLGINIPTHLEERLKNSEDILHDSVKLSRDIFEILYFYGKGKGIPVGCNVESVAIRKAEIEASIELLHDIQKIMER